MGKTFTANIYKNGSPPNRLISFGDTYRLVNNVFGNILCANYLEWEGEGSKAIVFFFGKNAIMGVSHIYKGTSWYKMKVN